MCTKIEAEDCVKREFCPECRGYGHEGEGCISDECQIFNDEVRKVLRDWWCAKVKTEMQKSEKSSEKQEPT